MISLIFLSPCCAFLSKREWEDLAADDVIQYFSALPILRQLGAQGGGSSLIKNLREGDTSMLKVWVGLEARKFLQASAEQVETCVKYDQLSPNV